MRTRLDALKNNATALKIPLTRLVRGKGRVPKTQARLKSDIADKHLFKSLSIRMDKLEKVIRIDGKDYKLTKPRRRLMQRYYALVIKMRRRGLLKQADARQLLLRPW